MAFKLFDKLSRDFSELLNDEREYNVIIEVDTEENKKSFTAHSVVLRYRSPYFDKELENVTADKNNIKTIINQSTSAQIFEIILKYIYGGIVNIEDMDTKTIYELMINAYELELKELSVKLESYLIESKASWLRTHFSLVYRLIFDSNEFKDLKKFYNDIIVKYPNLIFESEDFTSLQETALISILKRDDLNVEEIKIWDYVIKWGIAQNSTLPADSKEWSKENFEALKITLQQCLPLIRYFHIPGEVIWKKMKPYKKILEKQLWDDIILHSMSPNEPVNSFILPARVISNPELPSRTVSTPELPSIINEEHVIEFLPPPPRVTEPFLPIVNKEHVTEFSLPRLTEPFSNIITKEHAAELSSWIDRKSITYSLSNIPYEFHLILRGSRDGFHPKTFWKMCYGHSGTISVAKVAGTDEIVGGYNPLVWHNSSEDYQKTYDSFIFSLKNGNIRNSILSRVKDQSGALLYHKSGLQNVYGPCFGYSEFMMKSDVSDFTQDKRCQCEYYEDEDENNCYEKPIRTTSDEFSIMDYEVFKIIKKQIPNCTIR
ncbi:hypothetical protein Glove_87g254 [Diversispora epigaea]|uniref:BTB domain-containing protein n=1 Tax=Diversispora epigaea TaxID=1348612 RepID=A0A397J9P8_9GLOM|nr:hypothetical protein Glove_87g254 [Diversispora epigaea]